MTNKKGATNRMEKIISLGRNAVKDLQSTIQSQLDSQTVEIYDFHRDALYNGLFLRVFRYTVDFLLNPSLWAIDTSKILIRCTLESYIYLKYLTKNPESHKEFIKYGIGQEKLVKAKLAEALDMTEDIPEDTLNYINSPTDDEIWDELVSIKIKNYDNIRELFEELGEKALYDFKYQPYSVYVHGHWYALKTCYLKRCKNPLHRYHMIGDIQLPPYDLYSLTEMLRVFEMTYEIWCDYYKLDHLADSITHKYYEELNKLLKAKENKA